MRAKGEIGGIEAFVLDCTHCEPRFLYPSSALLAIGIDAVSHYMCALPNTFVYQRPRLTHSQELVQTLMADTHSMKAQTVYIPIQSNPIQSIKLGDKRRAWLCTSHNRTDSNNEEDRCEKSYSQAKPLQSRILPQRATTMSKDTTNQSAQTKRVSRRRDSQIITVRDCLEVFGVSKTDHDRYVDIGFKT